MEFKSKSATITVLPEYAEDFKAFMAKATRKHRRMTCAVEFSINDAIREHPDWFDLFLHQPKVSRHSILFYRDPDWLVRRHVSEGLKLMAVSA